eukprot:TRINITY_DN3668_c0_g1_i10.p1 TRINITY_DN3668_c0_g1~~TRINITY_DN3668_c0_g1_i10.p1  ORF type:complete len:444 (-),score=113.50 TRINITY_DN3668_c0_g1_i10:6-1337(-)
MDVKSQDISLWWTPLAYSAVDYVEVEDYDRFHDTVEDMLALDRVPTKQTFEKFLQALVQVESKCSIPSGKNLYEALLKTKELVFAKNLHLHDYVWKPSCMSWDFLYGIISVLVNQDNHPEALVANNVLGLRFLCSWWFTEREGGLPCSLAEVLSKTVQRTNRNIVNSCLEEVLESLRKKPVKKANPARRVLQDFFSVLCFAQPTECFPSLSNDFLLFSWKDQQHLLDHIHISVRGLVIDYMIKKDYNLTGHPFQNRYMEPSWEAMAEYYFCLRQLKKKTGARRLRSSDHSPDFMMLIGLLNQLLRTFLDTEELRIKESRKHEKLEGGSKEESTEKNKEEKEEKKDNLEGKKEEKEESKGQIEEMNVETEGEQSEKAEENDMKIEEEAQSESESHEEEPKKTRGRARGRTRGRARGRGRVSRCSNIEDKRKSKRKRKSVEMFKY